MEFGPRDVAITPQAQPELDHFKCYKARGERVDIIVSLEDQFGLEPGVMVGKPELFCNPVDKDGEGIIDPTAHLTCYKIHDRDKGSKREVLIDNQFGEQTLKVKKPELLCVPSIKTDLSLFKDDKDD